MSEVGKRPEGSWLAESLVAIGSGVLLLVFDDLWREDRWEVNGIPIRYAAWFFLAVGAWMLVDSLRKR